MQAAVRRREAGGRTPDPVTTLSETFADVGGAVGRHLLAALLFGALSAPVILVVLACAMPLLFLALVGGLLVQLVVLGVGQLAVHPVHGLGLSKGAVQPLVSFGVQLSELVPAAGSFVLGWLVFAVLSVLLSPLSAGWQRAVARDQRGEAELDPASLPVLAGRDLGSVVLCSAAVNTAVTLAALTTGPGCVLPWVLFGAAPTLVALYRISWWRALALSARHAWRNPALHIGYQLGLYVLGGLLGGIPLLGPAFLMSLQVRTWRAVFGDDPEPVLAMAPVAVMRPVSATA